MQMIGWSALYMTGNGKTITTNGCANLKQTISIYGTSISLADDLIMTDVTASYATITVLTGTFDTNGKTVTVYEFKDGWVNPKVITLGASTINCYAGGWNMAETTDLTINANTSTIKVNSTGAFVGGGKTYNNVELNGTAHTISGSNTFASLSFKPSATQTITWTDTTTQTANSFSRTGTGQITFQGSAAAGWNITDANGGTNTINALTVSRSTAAGGTFNATTSSLDSGNNNGWTFPTTITTSAVTGILSNSATGNATITDQGGSAITERGFCWNTTGTPTTASNKVIVAGTLGTYTGSLTSLLPTTTYYVRAYLVNGSGTSYSNEVNFVPVFTQQGSNLGYWAIPMVFLALGILLILGFNFDALGTIGIKNLIYIAVIIFIMFAMLMAFNPQLNTLP
jgi:hypothetical protein